MCIIGGVTDKDLEILLSVIHSKVEATMRQVAALERSRPPDRLPGTGAAELLHQLAWELQGIAWHYGFPDVPTLLGELKQREARRMLRASFLQMRFGYSYRFIPSWRPPFYGLN